MFSEGIATFFRFGAPLCCGVGDRRTRLNPKPYFFILGWMVLVLPRKPCGSGLQNLAF